MSKDRKYQCPFCLLWWSFPSCMCDEAEVDRINRRKHPEYRSQK